MQEIEIAIEGLTPLLLRNPAGMRLPSDRLTKKQIPTPADEAEAGTYRTETGELYLPSAAFRACLMSAAKGRTFGPKKFATTIVKGSVFTVDECTLLTDLAGAPLKDYEIYICRVVIKGAGGGSVMRARARVPKWAATVRFEIDEDFIAESQVRELLGIGGRIVGVGDFRPERSGVFGRFRVID